MSADKSLKIIKTPVTLPDGGTYLVQVVHVKGPEVRFEPSRPDDAPLQEYMAKVSQEILESCGVSQEGLRGKNKTTP